MDRSSDLHVVFGGTGAVGSAVVRELVRRGWRARVVHRGGSVDLPAGVELIQGSATDEASSRQAAEGAAVVYHCIGAPQHRWTSVLPPIMETLISAAGAVGTTLVYADNLYMYPPTSSPMTEALPDAPVTRKGRLRAKLAATLLAAHRQGTVQAVIGRASDFYGPGGRMSAVGDVFFGRFVAGRSIQWLGRTDMPHSITYLDDFARGLVTLGTHEDAWGQVWHVPTAAPLTGAQYAALAAKEAGVPVRISRVSPLMLRLGGFFSPLLRETVEMQFEFQQPYILDDAKYIRAFGGEPTPYDEAFRQTIAWFREQAKS
jgi:nucleoside-diphosphate-sugar epimerase